MKHFHPVIREWFWLLVVLLVLAFILPWGKEGVLWRSDRSMYDLVLEIKQRDAHADIVLVAIDEPSLSAVGQWPWPRKTHAQLLEKLKPARAVFLDLEFAEVDSQAPENDVLLAQAIATHGKVVLPVSMQTDRNGLTMPRYPIQAFRDAAAALGHFQVVLDADGIVRRVPLQISLNDNRFAQAMPVMLQVAGLGPKVSSSLASAPIPTNLMASQNLLIAYAGPIGKFQRISYSKILEGSVSPEQFAGKLVLVGMAANNSGDLYPTPYSGSDSRNMPGIEIHANIADSLLSKIHLRELGPLGIAFFSGLVLLIVFTSFLVLSPRWSLFTTFLTMLGVLVAAILALSYLDTWLSPIYALVLLIFAYPLWSWRRLEGTQRYIEAEIARLGKEKLVLPVLSPERAGYGSSASSELSPSSTKVLQPVALKLVDHVEQRIVALREAGERLSDVNRFVSDSLDQSPDGIVVTDRAGVVLLGNARAALYLKVDTERSLLGKRLSTLLSELDLEEGSSWTAVLDPAFSQERTTQIEARTKDGRDILVRLSPLYNGRAHQTGVITSMTEISALRDAERKRDESIKILTHDMRTPQAAMLTLIDLHHQKPEQLPAAELVSRLKKYCERTISLAEGFLRLATAEQGDRSKFSEVDLVTVLDEAADETWPLAQKRGIAVRRVYMSVQGLDEAIVWGDNELLRRAFVNLLSNAIKYSPEKTIISLALVSDGHHFIASVTDQGYGIPKNRVDSLFGRFARVAESNPEKQEGVGLGLAMVKAVTKLHQGDVTVLSTVEADVNESHPRGTTFLVRLPRHL